MEDKHENSGISARKEVEERLDNLFDSAEACDKVQDLAIWHILTAFEDFCRFCLAGDNECDFEDIPVRIDNKKYALKHSLDVILRDTVKSTITLKQRVTGTSYEKAFKLLIFGSKYQRLFRAIASSFNGRSTFIKSDSRYEIEVSKEHNPAYSVLEVIAHGQEPIFDFIVLAYGVLRGESNQKKIQNDIIEESRARLKNKLVDYTYNPDYANYLANMVQQRPEVIPNEFQFPWGNGIETQMLINSLSIRCLYHLLVVDSLGRLKNVRGINYQSLVMKTTVHELVEELSIFTGNVTPDNIEKFINFLTFGNKINNPDPALQPLFKTQKDEILIPCSLIITNNMQRNLLSLYTRIHSSEFNKKSNIFEQKMIDEASGWINRIEHSLINEVISIENEKEEIDVLLIEPSSKIILALEFRWFLQPGDAREVQQRITTCHQKVVQLDRKIKFLNAHSKSILEKYFPSLDSTLDWNVRGAVVIKGFGGQESLNEEIPIITIDVLNIFAEKLPNLEKLYSWIKSKVWLPQENEHFSSVIDEVDLDGFVVSNPSIELRVSPRKYKEYVQSTI